MEDPRSRQTWDMMRRTAAARRENDETLVSLLPAARCLGIELYNMEFVRRRTDACEWREEGGRKKFEVGKGDCFVIGARSRIPVSVRAVQNLAGGARRSLLHTYTFITFATDNQVTFPALGLLLME